MKAKVILYCIILSFVSLAGKCQESQADAPKNENTVILKIEFITLTRGYQKQVSISPDSLVKITDGRQNDRHVVKKAIPESQWQELVNSLNNIPVEEIPELPSPTSKRAFDGAMHSSIVVWVKEDKSYNHGFDDENPHEKLQPLMALIKALAGPD